MTTMGTLAAKECRVLDIDDRGYEEWMMTHVEYF